MSEKCYCDALSEPGHKCWVCLEAWRDAAVEATAAPLRARIAELDEAWQRAMSVVAVARRHEATNPLIAEALKKHDDSFLASLRRSGSGNVWFADGGPESAPDHWRCKKDDDITLTVWSRTNGRYVWEVWRLQAEPDDPIMTGDAPSLDEAKRAAESWAETHSEEP